MFAITYPTSPASKLGCAVILARPGRKIPTSFTSYVPWVCISFTGSPALMLPSTTRTYTTTPRYVSNIESKINARNRSSFFPVGAGIRATTASRMSSIPIPFFALALTASSPGIARMSSICFTTVGMSALGRSILLITGIRVSPCLLARCTLATVCASTPWAASTIRSAPSQAARERDTSYAKSTCPGVSIRLSLYTSPFRALYRIVTGCALIVIPRSRSRSMESKNWS